MPYWYDFQIDGELNSCGLTLHYVCFVQVSSDLSLCAAKDLRI